MIGIDIASITVPKAENANTLNGYASYRFIKYNTTQIASDDNYNSRTQETSYSTYATIGPKTPVSVLSVAGSMGTSSSESNKYTAMGFQLAGATYNRGLFYRNIGSAGNGGNGSWMKVAMEANAVSLSDLEQILSLESKEERLSAIRTLKAEKIAEVEQFNKSADMLQKDVIEHNGGGTSTPSS